jgi:hypothetical protein
MKKKEKSKRKESKSGRGKEELKRVKRKGERKWGRREAVN